MATDANDGGRVEDEGDGDDVGLVGGGGPASTMDDEDAGDEELDDHGESLSRVDDEEV